jgi:short-subunit dehydrogenase
MYWLIMRKTIYISGHLNRVIERLITTTSGLVKGVAQAPDIDPEDTEVMFATNVTGLINMTQAVLSIFKKKSDGIRGDIVNIGSIAGREGYPGGSIYCATKAAVRTFTDALRRELISTRIRVIEVDPGQVETEFSVVRFYGDKSKADAVYKGVEPLTPEDIAEVVVFAVGRRENVVLADSLIFPNHQVSQGSLSPSCFVVLMNRVGGSDRYASQVVVQNRKLRYGMQRPWPLTKPSYSYHDAYMAQANTLTQPSPLGKVSATQSTLMSETLLS